MRSTSSSRCDFFFFFFFFFFFVSFVSAVVRVRLRRGHRCGASRGRPKPADPTSGHTARRRRPKPEPRCSHRSHVTVIGFAVGAYPLRGPRDGRGGRAGARAQPRQLGVADTDQKPGPGSGRGADVVERRSAPASERECARQRRVASCAGGRAQTRTSMSKPRPTEVGDASISGHVARTITGGGTVQRPRPHAGRGCRSPDARRSPHADGVAAARSSPVGEVEVLAYAMHSDEAALEVCRVDKRTRRGRLAVGGRLECGAHRERRCLACWGFALSAMAARGSRTRRHNRRDRARREPKLALHPCAPRSVGCCVDP